MGNKIVPSARNFRCMSDLPVEKNRETGGRMCADAFQSPGSEAVKPRLLFCFRPKNFRPIIDL